MYLKEKDNKLTRVKILNFICFIALLAYLFIAPSYFERLKFWPPVFIVAILIFLEGYSAVLKGEFGTKYGTYRKRINPIEFRRSVSLSYFLSLILFVFGLILIAKNI